MWISEAVKGWIKGKNALMAKWMDSSLAVWSGEAVTAAVLKLIPDVYAPHSTNWLTSLWQEPATGGAGFLYNLSKRVLTCHCLRSFLVWAASPSLAVIVCFRTGCFSTRHVDQHYHTCIKWIISTLTSHFFAPKMGLLWVCFSSPIKQMLPALWGIFWASQSLSLGGLPDAQVLCRAAHECQGGEWICLSNGKGKHSVAEPGGAGGGCRFKMEKWKQVENRRGQVPTAVEAVEGASDLEPDWPGLEPQRYHFQSLWVELFATSLNYRF